METLDITRVTQEQSQLGAYLKHCIDEASKIITPYWPISTFIASNGLGGLENLPFSEALEYARKLRKSEGYLPLTAYRAFFAQGRITEADLEGVISSYLSESQLPETVKLAGGPLSSHQLFKFWLLQVKDDQESASQKGELWAAIQQRLAPFKSLDAADQNANGDLETWGERSFAKDGQSVTNLINKRMMTWCSAFLDDGQAAWSMPGREQGFYKCWKALAAEDRSYAPQTLSKKLKALPAEAETALIMFLQELEIPRDSWAAYLTRHLAQLPGWASLVQWREQHPEVAAQQDYPINLVEYLAVRLFYETVLVAGTVTRVKKQAEPEAKSSFQKDQSPAQVAEVERNKAGTAYRLFCLAESRQISPATFAALAPETFQALAVLAANCSPAVQQRLWQEAYEWHYRHQLLGQLGAARATAQATTSPEPKFSAGTVQAVFCIDVRSEGLRRHLERLGPYETFGFAGFFGVPMLYQPFGSSCNLTVAPALITPTQIIKEVAKAAPAKAIQRRLSFNQWRYSWRELVHSLRENLLTPFAFVEMVGWYSIFPLIAKTVAPRGWRNLQTAVEQRLSAPVPTEPSIIANPDEMSLEAQAAAVANMLKSISLTSQFARLVLISGHGSETENNPYASALDCGACGGNHGGNSAFVAASVLNTAPVRQLLAQQGINIPAETFFLAGEHNTTTDEISFLNADRLPATHLALFEQFKRDMSQAGAKNAGERWQKLPGTNPLKTAVAQRAADWAQVRPEWGLVRNAAFICGRRSLTASVNLDNRVFLHSYEAEQDPDGAILEGIMTAPVVVAEWINMQYYLSSVDNAVFGSGTKLLHTVVGQQGVMQGRQSDLLIGLPQQSVMLGDQLYHEPLRLAVILEAPPARIQQIIAKHERLQFLTKNKWITVIACEPTTKTFHHLAAEDKWVEIAEPARP